MRLFVTGASGWIGSTVVPELIGAGHQVLGLARSDASAKAVADMGAEVLPGDLNDTDVLRAGAVVLEADPYRRLSYTWHTFTPEWATAYDITKEHRALVAAEPRSKVTFDIEPAGEYVRLTVVHDGLEPGSVVPAGISEGWPLLMSSLKSMLETGDALLVS